MIIIIIYFLSFLYHVFEVSLDIGSQKKVISIDLTTKRGAGLEGGGLKQKLHFLSILMIYG